MFFGVGWEKTVAETIQALSSKQVNAVWPRDTLFQYLQIMEDLQVLPWGGGSLTVCLTLD